MDHLSRAYDRSDIDPESNITPNFKWKEHLCKCGVCDPILLHASLYKKLEGLRALLSAPVKITSGYRCVTYNNKVDGAANSQHLLGLAADIKVKGCTPKEVGRAARKVGFTGVKVYPSWCHVDLRQNGTWFVGV